MSTRLYAGIGLASRCTTDEIMTLLDQVLSLYAAQREDILMLASLPEKIVDPALVSASLQLGIGLVAPPVARLQSVASRCLTTSERVQSRFNLPCIAEACALAAAPDLGVLLGPRLASLRATLALVRA